MQVNHTIPTVQTTQHNLAHTASPVPATWFPTQQQIPPGLQRFRKYFEQASVYGVHGFCGFFVKDQPGVQPQYYFFESESREGNSITNYFTIGDHGQVYRCPIDTNHTLHIEPGKGTPGTSVGREILRRFGPNFDQNGFRPEFIREIYAQFAFVESANYADSKFKFVYTSEPTQAVDERVIGDFPRFMYSFKGKETFFIHQPYFRACVPTCFNMMRLDLGLPLEWGLLSDARLSDSIFLHMLNKIASEVAERDPIGKYETVNICRRNPDGTFLDPDTFLFLAHDLLDKSCSPLIADLGGHVIMLDSIDLDSRTAIIRDPFFAIHAKVSLDIFNGERGVFSSVFGIVHHD